MRQLGPLIKQKVKFALPQALVAVPVKEKGKGVIGCTSNVMRLLKWSQDQLTAPPGLSCQLIFGGRLLASPPILTSAWWNPGHTPWQEPMIYGLPSTVGFVKAGVPTHTVLGTSNSPQSVSITKVMVPKPLL